MTSAFTMVNCNGDEIVLTKNSPALVRHLLVEATKDAAERFVGHRWAESDSDFEGRRVCPDLAIGFIAKGGGGKLTAQQIGAFRAAACGGIYTRSRAAEAGYDIIDECVHCGAAGDTPHHRVYCCPATREAVLQHVPAWLYAEGGRADPKSKFWTTAIGPHPADDWPLPAAEFDAMVVGDEEDSPGMEGWDDPLSGFGGDVFSDGSCVHSPIRGLARAGCASAQVDAVGNRARGMYLPICRKLLRQQSRLVRRFPRG